MIRFARALAGTPLLQWAAGCQVVTLCLWWWSTHPGNAWPWFWLWAPTLWPLAVLALWSGLVEVGCLLVDVKIRHEMARERRRYPLVKVTIA